MANKVQRLGWLDVMKALAAYMVCFYHLTENNKVVNFGHFDEHVYCLSIEKFFYGILVSCVPLFFIASGTTLTLKSRTAKTNVLRALQLILINCLWGCICNIFISSVETGTFVFSRDFFFHAPFYFWYLPTLAFVYIFDIVWQKVKDRRRSVSLFYFLLLVPFTLNIFGDILVFFNPSYASNSFLHSGFFRLYSLAFILVPAIWTSQLSKTMACLFIFVGMILVGFEVVAYSNATQEIYNGVNSSFPTWGALLSALGIYQLIKRIPASFDCSFIRCISSNCLGIYILHYPIIVLLVKYCSILNFGWIVQFFSAFIIILLASSASWVLKRCGLRYLI